VGTAFVLHFRKMSVKDGCRGTNNSGDISWHKTGIFISEVFRFEELAPELTTPGFYRVYFRDLEVGELNAEELRFRDARRVV
jgi:hypothetical protein